MSVETALGLDPHLAVQISDAWPEWTAARPDLAQVHEPTLLRRWLRHAAPADADEVLHGLAWLASPSGGDDTLAAQALAWSFLPAATQLAFRLRTLTPDIDHLVASELWSSIRSFPLERRKVAANLVRDLRTRVLREHQAATRFDRSGRVLLTPVEWLDEAWLSDDPHPDGPTPAEDLLDVLDWACRRGLITARDRELLLQLVDVAATAVRVRARSGLGLLTDDGALEVGRRMGMSATSVRRHARRALDALVAEAPQYQLTA